MILDLSCSRNQFKCKSNECIADSSQCDGYDDCTDGSDEQFCDCGQRQVETPGASPFIIGGNPASKGDWPWQVAVSWIVTCKW